VGVFLCYGSDKGAALVERELYIPQGWAADLERRRAAGIPDTVEFATKPEFARRMSGCALDPPQRPRPVAGDPGDSGATAAWVAADEVYGHDRKLRRFLESRQMAYVLAVASDQRLWQPDFMQHRMDAIAQSLPASRWKRLCAGLGSKGERLYDWALMELSKQDGWTRALLVRCSIDEEPECAYYLCYAPRGKDTIETLVRVASERWKIEQCFETAKGECGLDHYEVRHWRGWYRHITLSMLAHAVLSMLRAHGEKTPHAQVRLSVPERRHLLTRMLWRGWHGLEHLLHWFQWPRRHQFQAMCCHYRKRGSPLPALYLQLHCCPVKSRRESAGCNQQLVEPSVPT
jgi:SRSO17 transposase